MNVREASEEDAAAIGELVDADIDVDRLLRERMVVLAETDDDIVGVLSYEVWADTVHVSTVVGEPSVVDELLDPPRRFADSEGMPIEIVVPDHDDSLRTVVTESGFDVVGRGPEFGGTPTHRYRYDG